MRYVAKGLEIKLDCSIEFIFKVNILLGDENERRRENSHVKPRVSHFREARLGGATDLDQVDHRILEEYQIHAGTTDALVIELQEHIQTLP